MKKLFIIIPLVLLLASGVILLKKRKKAIADAPVAEPITFAVRTVKAEEGTVTRQASFLARIESLNQAAISAKFSGRIEELMVRETDKVKKGELLVRIDDAEPVATRKSLVAQLEAAKAQLAYQAEQHKRDQALFDAGGLAREKLQASQVALAQADAAVRDIRAKIAATDNQLAYLSITAPFAGTIGSVFLHHGDMAAPGKPILTLNSPEQKLTFRFAPGSVPVRIGQEAVWQDRHLGKIVRIYDDADNGLAVAEIAPDISLALPLESFISIDLILARAEGCRVPIEALLHGKDCTAVMVYRDGRFQSQPVNLTLQGRKHALVAPCPTDPVAVAPEAKLSLLPGHGRIKILSPTSETGQRQP
jgi:RND family efflux transporter MFP subunit